MEMTSILAQLSSTGKRALEVLAHERPLLVRQLRVGGRLLPELEDAQSHFQARLVHHSDDYENMNPRPQDSAGVMRHMTMREAYVNAEVHREMKNWVSNYPTLDSRAPQKQA